MSTLEIIYWTVLTPTAIISAFVFASYLEDLQISIGLIIPYFVFSLLISMMGEDTNKEISSNFVEIVYSKMVDDRLVIVTLEGERKEYSDYSSIKKWENGFKLKKTESVKVDYFGLDKESTKYEFVEEDSLRKNKFEAIEGEFKN
jgi:hypothetical protein